MTDQKAISATITGRVQGVGYRYSAVAEAGRLGLVGWVRNAPDGSVETRAQGHGPALDEFVAFLHHGPRSARVGFVAVRPVAVDASLKGFSVRS
jgi:acylphosphatase